MKIGLLRGVMGVRPEDNGERRVGIERRQFSYTLHIPERRNTGDRRKGDLRNDSEAKMSFTPLSEVARREGQGHDGSNSANRH